MGISIGGLVGGAIGAAAGGPAGAAAGYAIGSGLGGKKRSAGGPGGPKIPQFGMKKTEDFIKQDPRIEVGGPNAAGAMSRRFNSLRERTGNQVNASVGTASDAIKRRFASQGAAGSGAQIKAEMLLQDQGERQKQDAYQGIDAQQGQEELGLAGSQADMDFKQKVFSFERGSKMHELDLAERQQQQDAVATDINARTAAQMAKPPKQGLISNILGDLL